MRLVLASRSPRRAELLRAAGFTFEILPFDIDERRRAGESAHAYVQRLAEEKAAAAWGEIPRTLSGPADRFTVLAADTAVVVDDAILGKPVTDAEARSMLKQLSGRAHDVLTGVCVSTRKKASSFVELTTVEFDPLSDDDIAWYVASGEGRDKAGAYAIQGLASRFIPRILGSYSNVVGLPVAQTHELILQMTQTAGPSELASP
jgi:septum formation protein